MYASVGLLEASQLKKILYSKLSKPIKFLEFSPEFAFSDIPDTDGWVVSGGYNTVMDVIHSKRPALIIGLDEEQQTRANIFSLNLSWVGALQLQASAKEIIETWEIITSKTCPEGEDFPYTTNGAKNVADFINQDLHDASNLYTC